MTDAERVKLAIELKTQSTVATECDDGCPLPWFAWLALDGFEELEMNGETELQALERLAVHYNVEVPR